MPSVPAHARSRQAIETDLHPERAVVSPATDTTTAGAVDGPDAMLWVALVLAPEEGITVPGLMTATGMSRPWIYPPTRTRRTRPCHPSHSRPLARRNR
jgi:hypothetical protein